MYAVFFSEETHVRFIVTRYKGGDNGNEQGLLAA